MTLITADLMKQITLTTVMAVRQFSDIKLIETREKYSV